MAGGNPKGSNAGGGFKKGQKTRKTLERELVAARAQEAVRAADQVAAAGGAKLAKDVLREAMNYFYGLAALYQPSASNRQADEKKFAAYMKQATDIAGDLIPYETPRLQSTVLKGDKTAPIHHVVEIEFIDGSGTPVSPADALASGIRPADAEASPV